MLKIVGYMALQALAVAVISASLSYLVWAENYRSLFNLAWALFIPACVAFVFNRGYALKGLMLVILCAISVFNMGFVGVILGFY